MTNPWLIFVEILIAGAILWYLFFRRKPESASEAGVQRVEIKLSGNELTPSDIRVDYNRSTQLYIHRFDSEPDEELFEIDELKVYALLPARHTTIIPFNPQQRGAFPLVLAANRPAGTIIVV